MTSANIAEEKLKEIMKRDIKKKEYWKVLFLITQKYALRSPRGFNSVEVASGIINKHEDKLTEEEKKFLMNVIGDVGGYT